MEPCVITLAREFGSGGHSIALRVAELLGIPCYDKELITLAAKKSGLSEQAIAASEKQRTGSLLYNLYTIGNDLPLGDQVFILQSNIIKELAAKGPCIIVGRRTAASWSVDAAFPSERGHRRQRPGRIPR